MNIDEVILDFEEMKKLLKELHVAFELATSESQKFIYKTIYDLTELALDTQKFMEFGHS